MGTMVSDWLEFLDQRFPPSWAEEWDNSRFQVGDWSWPAVMASLDLADPVANAVASALEALVSEIPTDPFGRP